MIRVQIAEDHAVVRAGLEQLLATAEDLDLVAVAGNGAEAVELAAEHEPDVVLMDLVMPQMDGVAATRAIVAARPETRVVVLTSFSDRERILDALDAGAAGYLLKDADPAEVLRGVRVAAAGEALLDPKAAAALLRRRQAAGRGGPGPGGGDASLSPREREVLGLVAEGRPNKLIARDLGISEKTVKAHLTRVFEQLGVTDRVQAALWAQRHLGAPGS